LKVVTVRFSTKQQCPWWDNHTGECRLKGGPLYCGNNPRDEPSGHCPVENASQEHQYTNEQIKRVFWKLFHKSGELWFNYLSNEEECENSTRSHWNDFEKELQNEGAPVVPEKIGAMPQ